MRMWMALPAGDEAHTPVQDSPLLVGAWRALASYVHVSDDELSLVADGRRKHPVRADATVASLLVAARKRPDGWKARPVNSLRSLARSVAQAKGKLK